MATATITNPTPIDSSTQPEPSYTIIRVKRKLPDISTNSGDNSTGDDRFTSFKRLRHIGSFSTAPNEAILSKNNLLKQMGFPSRKRLRISDLNAEQFAAYVSKLDATEKSGLKKAKESSNTDLDEVKEEPTIEDVQKDETANSVAEITDDIFNISLEQEDFAPFNDNNNQKSEDNEIITCNGSILTELQSRSEQYVYDYYVLMDSLLDFEEPEETVDDGADDDSNDENYRYNDYPDEGDSQTDSEDDDDDTDSDDVSGSEYGYRQYGDEDGPECYDEEDEEDGDDDKAKEREFCEEFQRRMRLKITGSDSEDGDSDD